MDGSKMEFLQKPTQDWISRLFQKGWLVQLLQLISFTQSCNRAFHLGQRILVLQGLLLSA